MFRNCALVSAKYMSPRLHVHTNYYNSIIILLSTAEPNELLSKTVVPERGERGTWFNRLDRLETSMQQSIYVSSYENQF